MLDLSEDPVSKHAALGSANGRKFVCSEAKAQDNEHRQTFDPPKILWVYCFMVTYTSLHQSVTPLSHLATLSSSLNSDRDRNN